MSRALFVGRFQPFHKGHEYALNLILDREDEVIIAVGSAQENYTLKNPLTVGERIEVIWAYIKARNLTNRVLIVPIPDINNNKLWPYHVISLVPRFDVVYSGNKLVVLLFKEAGYKVFEINEISKQELSGTTIRNKILRGEPWQHLVPSSIVNKLKELGFEERIKRLKEIYGL